MRLTLEEQMALAVLKGGKEGMAAGRALADKLLERIQSDAMNIESVNKITVSLDKVKVVVYVPQGSRVQNPSDMQHRIAQWLRDDRECGMLVLQGVEKMEIYQIDGKG